MNKPLYILAQKNSTFGNSERYCFMDNIYYATRSSAKKLDRFKELNTIESFDDWYSDFGINAKILIYSE